MTSSTDTITDRNTEAVALIDAWLNEHAWWADARSIDFALDVRAVLAERPDDEADTAEADTD